jgi:hypothetical protein
MAAPATVSPPYGTKEEKLENNEDWTNLHDIHFTPHRPTMLEEADMIVCSLRNTSGLCLLEKLVSGSLVAVIGDVEERLQNAFSKTAARAN